MTDHRINLTLYKLQQVDGRAASMSSSRRCSRVLPGRAARGGTRASRPGSSPIDSVTGIDVSLPLAGAGARSYAFIVDVAHPPRCSGFACAFSGALAITAACPLNPPLTKRGALVRRRCAPALRTIYFLLPLRARGGDVRSSTPGQAHGAVRSSPARTAGVPGIGPLLVRHVIPPRQPACRCSTDWD